MSMMKRLALVSVLVATLSLLHAEAPKKMGDGMGASKCGAMKMGAMKGCNTKMCNMKGKKMHGMHRVNPMPNLMRIAIGNAALLQITPEQLTQLNSWVDSKRPQMMQLVKEVMMTERMMRQEALGADADVLKMADKALGARKAIIEMKTACRAHLRKVLSKEQYANVLNIYQSVRKR